MRSVVVTGASTGIGRATTAALVAARFHVWATVRRPDDAASLQAEHGDAVTTLLLDITDDTAVRAAGEQVLAAGPLSALVNNAGAALPGPLEHLPLDVLRRQLEVNLVAQLAVTQAMLPALRASRDAGRDARIVMIGSIGGRIAGPVLGAYSAAKFGLVGLTGSLRAELAPSGIRVLLVEPGAIATPIWSRGAAAGQVVADAMPPEALVRYRDQIDRALANDAPRAAARRRAARNRSAWPLQRRRSARDVRRAAVTRAPVVPARAASVRDPLRVRRGRPGCRAP